MRLLRVGNRDPLTVLLFGLGLIGATIDRALRQRFETTTVDLPYSWNDPARREGEKTAIRAALPLTGRVALVWAGGQNGFGASDAEMQLETALLAEIVQFAVALGRERAVDFHMMSSAGGLFEGQTHCTTESVPHPLRPYGRGKLAQETLLLATEGLSRRVIYRPSSVYGMTQSKRIGLVTALVSNVLHGRTTRITGSPYTLRDFLLADDIGQFVAQQIVSPPPGPDNRTHLLASGRSASVFEVIERIRSRIDRPVFLQYDSRPTNAGDMSFLPSALPPDWQATPLASGISHTLALFRSGFSWGRA
ncbi:MAG: NAD-dependent epimerase/dehydratase family protein [Tabrizicola sp.]|nr:NAD-dependent epimerase/dehydratase family protein [Tabrizicola sp.]